MRPNLLALLVGLLACGGSHNSDSSDGTSEAAPAADSKLTIDRDDLRLVASTGGDSVWMAAGDSGTFLLWRSAPRQRTWRSPSLLGASPIVRLVDASGDSQTDLFYTVEYEEFIFGALVLSEGSSARQAYLTSAMLCGAPRLEDVNGDGRLDVVEFRPSALAEDECRGDPYGAACHDSFPTDWPVPLQQRASGAFEEDSVQAEEFYSARAQEFELGAERLRRDLASRSGVASDSPRCNQQMLEAIEAMASRARRLSR